MFEMVMSVLLIQIAGQMISIPIVMTTMYWIFENPLGGSAITLVSLLGLTGLTGVLYGKYICISYIILFFHTKVKNRNTILTYLNLESFF